MHGGWSTETSGDKLLKEGHAERPSGFAVKSQNQQLLKLATNSMVMYLILLIIKKCNTKTIIQNKNNLCV